MTRHASPRSRSLSPFHVPGRAGGAPASATRGGENWTPPRTPDGQPDIQGIWSEEQGGADGTNVETSFQTIDTLMVQGWSDERIKATEAHQRARRYSRRKDSLPAVGGGATPAHPQPVWRRRDHREADEPARDQSRDLLHPRHAAAGLLGRLPDDAGPRLHRAVLGTHARLSHRAARRPSPSALQYQAAHGRRARPMGRQHARRQHDEHE